MILRFGAAVLEMKALCHLCFCDATQSGSVADCSSHSEQASSLGSLKRLRLRPNVRAQGFCLDLATSGLRKVASHNSFFLTKIVYR